MPIIGGLGRLSAATGRAPWQLSSTTLPRHTRVFTACSVLRQQGPVNPQQPPQQPFPTYFSDSKQPYPSKFAAHLPGTPPPPPPPPPPPKGKSIFRHLRSAALLSAGLISGLWLSHSIFRHIGLGPDEDSEDWEDWCKRRELDVMRRAAAPEVAAKDMILKLGMTELDTSRLPPFAIPCDCGEEHPLNAGPLSDPGAVDYLRVFYSDDGPGSAVQLTAFVSPGPALCGWPGVLHGGALATLLLEAIHWTAFMSTRRDVDGAADWADPATWYRESLLAWFEAGGDGQSPPRPSPVIPFARSLVLDFKRPSPSDRFYTINAVCDRAEAMVARGVLQPGQVPDGTLIAMAAIQPVMEAEKNAYNVIATAILGFTKTPAELFFPLVPADALEEIQRRVTDASAQNDGSQ